MTTPQTGQIRISTRYHWLAFTFAAFKPKAVINGHTVQLNWGENFIPAPPGTHNIEIHIPYLWKFGKAAITVDNTMGIPAIDYAAPMLTWQRGAIGYEQQKFPGLVATYVLYGIVALGVVACCIGTALAGGNG